MFFFAICKSERIKIVKKRILLNYGRNEKDKWDITDGNLLISMIIWICLKWVIEFSESKINSMIYHINDLYTYMVPYFLTAFLTVMLSPVQQFVIINNYLIQMWPKVCWNRFGFYIDFSFYWVEKYMRSVRLRAKVRVFFKAYNS